ncbi:MAG: hypothetical protein KAX16_05255 [Actinomycetia bacterium]|nr:hypothetical protein [Actinomycetes bacterium]
MEQHVKIIGIIDIVFGILGIIGGIFFIIAFMLGAGAIGSQADVNAAEGAAIFASVGLFGGLAIIAMSAFQIVVGVKLKAYKSWARIVQIIFGIFALPGFPLGTAFGVYTLWAMFNQDTAVLFTEDN